MDKKEKLAKKSRISEDIDLAGGRFKDDEVDTLFDLVSNLGKYLGKSHASSSTHDGWCSDGKFARKESESYTISQDDEGVYVDYRSEYHDDDGQSGSYSERIGTARGILKVIDLILG